MTVEKLVFGCNVSESALTCSAVSEPRAANRRTGTHGEKGPMAFAGLFSRLSAVEEPAGPELTHRYQAESGRRGRGWKRRAQAGQTGPGRQRCYQAKAYNTTSCKDDDSEARRYHMPHTDREHAGLGFSKEVTHNHSDKAGYGNRCHRDQNHRDKTNQEKKTKGRKIQRQQRGTGRPGNGQTRATSRRGGWENKLKVAKDIKVKHTSSMTQEFMDQNVLLVDGRLLCRHFLWGRCIKGDDCQLEHIQGYNDVIKEVCKFYVQGFCSKGESCPYMHKSFPCKFFHRIGNCTKGADCRFSHEPLNDVTTHLLDMALKRDSDLAKKDEQESLGQPAYTEESEMAEANRVADILTHPLRPNFYKSADTDAEKEALSSQTEELDDVMEANSGHASDGAQPHSPPSTNLDHKEPVCYSVEAVLGPQLSKPFPSFCPAPGSQESAPPSSSGCTSDSVDQKEVPYSVSAVLRSCKSVKYFTLGHTPTALTAQTVSYTPKSYFEETTEPLLSSDTQTKKLLCSLNTRNEANKSQEKQFKSLPSLQVHSSLISKTSPNLSLASGDDWKHSENMPKPMNPSQTASHQVKLDLSQSPVTVAEKSASPKIKGGLRGNSHLPADSTFSVNSKSGNILPFGPTMHKYIFSRPPSQTSASKQLKPHISVLIPDSSASVKPFSPSSGLTESEDRVAAPVEPVTKTGDSTNSVSGHFAAKPAVLNPNSEKTPADLDVDTLQHQSTENTAECGSKVAHCDELVGGSIKTQKRSFHSFFGSPTADTLQPTGSSVTGSSCPQSLIQASCPAPQSADCRSNRLKTAAEPASSFLSLFAVPLRAAPLPHMQSQPGYSRTSTLPEQSKQSVDHTSDLSDSTQKTSNLETPLPHQNATEVNEILRVPRSPNFSLNPEVGNEEHMNQPTRQLVNPVCSLLSDSVSEMSTSAAPHGNCPSAAPVHQQETDISSHKGSAVVATEKSVLKTLFLSLSPYQQDGEQQDGIQTSVPPENEKDKSSTECVFVKQKKSKKKGKQQKQLKTQDSHKKFTLKTVALSTEHQPSPHTPQISVKAKGWSILSPAMTEPQVRNSGTHNLPLKPEVLPTQTNTRPRLKHTSEEVCGNGNVVPTPLKDLFKTLDTTVHFGH